MNWSHCYSDDRGVFLPCLALLACAISASLAAADPVLPDWTQAVFGDDSDVSTHPYYPITPGWISIFEGEEDEGLERIESFVTMQTKTILGVETRVVRDTEYIDGVLVEIALDWYAQSDDGTVWYFGEDVTNYNYDDNGDFIGTDDEGSWIADGVVNFPGAIMLASPMVGDEYFQEYAPGVALDFAIVNALDATVDIDFGYFENALHTSEGNLIDGPELAENKLYGLDTGLVLIEALDDNGEPEFFIPLIDRYFVPAPGGAAIVGLGAAVAGARRRRE